MKNMLLALFVLGLVVSCAHRTSMSRDEVVRTANRAAVAAGYSLAEYRDPELHFELLERDRTWTVRYDRPVSYPGSDFLVVVDERTGKTEVLRGE